MYRAVLPKTTRLMLDRFNLLIFQLLISILGKEKNKQLITIHANPVLHAVKEVHTNKHTFLLTCFMANNFCLTFRLDFNFD